MTCEIGGKGAFFQRRKPRRSKILVPFQGTSEWLGAAHRRTVPPQHHLESAMRQPLGESNSGVGSGTRVGGIPGGLASGGPRSNIRPSSNDRPTRLDKWIRERSNWIVARNSGLACLSRRSRNP